MAVRSSAADDNIVRVRLCQHATAAQNDDKKKWRIYRPDTYASFQQWKSDLEDHFGFAPNSFRVAIHAPDSCADEMQLHHLQTSGLVEANALYRLNPTVEVCFSPKKSVYARLAHKLSSLKVEQNDDADNKHEVKQSSEDEAATGCTPVRHRSHGDPDLVVRGHSEPNATSRNNGRKKGAVHYVRVGRRTRKDLDGRFPTRCLIVAKIDLMKQKVVWLEVETWLVNGLRIGNVEFGDTIHDSEELQWTGYFDTEPYYSANGAITPAQVKQHLLERANLGETSTESETMNEEEVYDQKSRASMARLRAIDVGYAHPCQDPRLQFKHPWQLPVEPKMSKHVFPHGLPRFRSLSHQSSSIEAVITFVNEIGDMSLGLIHHIQALLDRKEELQEVKDYIMDGDDQGFDGIDNHSALRDKEWTLELWVLPQVRGCSTLYKWDDVPELFASAFCARENDCAETDGIARLYIQAHLVPEAGKSDNNSADESSPLSPAVDDA